ncbi:adenosylcobinamide-GDP ribazoletransferase [Allorhizobium pseudoryzae]|uniref:adenosylcobinamide-GDP ribazoletransferase n=1 Tax=Allorhizobium pseudoryzae TaxID=379684 RepID=UPI003D08AE81
MSAAFKELPLDLARSLGFLSRLPVPARCFAGYDGSMGRTARAFPLAGLVIAAPSAALLGLLPHRPETALLLSLLTLGLSTLLSGALHEDGLADSADGLFGGRDREHALTIMKDSRIGAYGVIALILSFGLRTAALAALLASAAPLLAPLILLAAASLSRALMVWHWQTLGPARPGGTAAAVGQPSAASRNLALVMGAALALLLSRLAPAPPLAVLVAFAVSAFAALLFARKVRRTIGGHTGDTIGATQQITETAFLCALAVAL